MRPYIINHKMRMRIGIAEHHPISTCESKICHPSHAVVMSDLTCDSLSFSLSLFWAPLDTVRPLGTSMHYFARYILLLYLSPTTSPAFLAPVPPLFLSPPLSLFSHILFSLFYPARSLIRLFVALLPCFLSCSLASQPSDI